MLSGKHKKKKLLQLNLVIAGENGLEPATLSASTHILLNTLNRSNMG
jgi:hypothetical protein